MRYPPIPEAEWSAEQRTIARAIVDGPRGELRGPFVPLLHAPAIAAKVQELGEVIRFKTSIPNALLEIAVLITARHHNCPNIWESHAKLAAKAGVSARLIAALAKRERPARMSADETLVHSFATQLLDNNRVSDATFTAMTERWGRKGAMELAGICGYYGMLAAVLNASERPLVDPAGTPFGV